MSRTIIKFGPGGQAVSAGPPATYTVAENPLAGFADGNGVPGGSAINEQLLRQRLPPQLCDDMLNDSEFATAADKSGSSVVDLSRIRLMDATILGQQHGAFAAGDVTQWRGGGCIPGNGPYN